MASSMTDFALIYPEIAVDHAASRRSSATSTPFASRNGTPRTSVDADRKGKGKEKENETTVKPKSKSKSTSKNSDNAAVRPDPAAEAMGTWFMWK